MNGCGKRTAARRAILLAAVVATAFAAPGVAGDRFALAIGAAVDAGLSPAAEQRLAIWNSPMGRLAAAVNDAQSTLGMSGLVGHPYGVAISMGFRPRLRPELISHAVRSGFQLSSRELEPIHWPWGKPADDGQPALTLEEQLSILLGRRLELR